jgi:hypothetical protein
MNRDELYELELEEKRLEELEAEQELKRKDDD